MIDILIDARLRRIQSSNIYIFYHKITFFEEAYLADNGVLNRAGRTLELMAKISNMMQDEQLNHDHIKAGNIFCN